MNRDETAQSYISRILSNISDRDPWAVLTTTAGRLRELIAGRTIEQLARRPEPSKWSAVEILAHLADAEVVAGWRIRSILASDGAPLQPFDQDAWASALRYAETDPFQSCELFAVNRASLLSLLNRVDPKLHANHGLHAERGRESIEHLVRLYAGHDLNHLRQLEGLVATLPPIVFRPSAVPAASAPLDVRVGTIESAEPVAGSRKLAALRVNFGDHHRTIVAGIAKERGDLEPLVGRQALFVVNLPPKQMSGVTSEGMLFDLGYADGIKPALAVPEFPVPNGTRAG